MGGPGGVSGGGRWRMRGDFVPHSGVTPSAGTCRGGASRMRISAFGAETHLVDTEWLYGALESFCGTVLPVFGRFRDTEWPNAHFKAFCGIAEWRRQRKEGLSGGWPINTGALPQTLPLQPAISTYLPSRLTLSPAGEHEGERNPPKALLSVPSPPAAPLPHLVQNDSMKYFCRKTEYNYE